MSLRKHNLVPGEIYHIYNRGVDKRNVFMDDEDFLRFVHDLFEFNNEEAVSNLGINLKTNKYKEVGIISKKSKPRKVLVDILVYCLMDNHFHLLVRQKTEHGITEFMRKVGTGYTNYFNKKYNRQGSLFQGRFKSVNVNKSAHLMYLPIYIHLNALDFKFPEWRKGKIKDYKKAIEFLDSYRWSSYMDYIGKKNFPLIIKKDFILSRLGYKENQKKEVIDWIKSLKDLNIKEITLE